MYLQLPFLGHGRLNSEPTADQGRGSDGARLSQVSLLLNESEPVARLTEGTSIRSNSVSCTSNLSRENHSVIWKFKLVARTPNSVAVGFARGAGPRCQHFRVPVSHAATWSMD